jgi:hypothetical protein
MIRDDSNNKIHINLTIDLWNKIYEKLFGGFEDLAVTGGDDDDEDDELDTVPKNMKTKNGGYLKDGFVVDSSDIEESDSSDTDDENSEDIIDESCDCDEELILEDIGSELSEESYDYSDDEK